MSALSEDDVADLARKIAALEERLRSAEAERDAAVEGKTAATLEQFRLETELRAALDRQKASKEILHAIANTHGEAEHALQQIAETTQHFFNASSVTIRITDGKQWIRTIRVGGGSERIMADTPASELAVDGKNVAGLVYRENRQIHVPDLDHVDASIADFPGFAPARAGGSRTVSGTPLRQVAGAIGALIIHRDRLAPFTDDELALQQSFADQAVIAIENARLFNETQEALDHQRASAEILRTIASATGDATRSLEQIAETCGQLFGAPSVGIQLIENGQWAEALRFGAIAQQIRSVVPLSSIKIGGPNLPGQIIARNGQINIPDLDHLDPSMAEWPGLPVARAAGARTICGTPLRREGQAIGALIVYRDRLAAFTEEELALQQSFADQAAIAIENARLFNETKEALERQTATSDILRVINNSTGNLPPVFESILEKAHHLCGAPCGSLQLYENDRVVPVAIRGMTAAFAEHLRRGYAITASNRSILTAAHPVQRLDLAETARLEPENSASRAAVELGGLRTLVAIPLVKDGVTFGRIVAARQEFRAFTDKQIALLQGFADQAVIAIENARLFNETKEALERQTATADILKVIASSPSDVKPVFEAIVTSAAKLFEPCAATITTAKDGKLHWQTTHALLPGYDIEGAKTIYPIPFDPDRSPSARAILERRIIEIPDTDAPDSPEFTRKAAAAGGFRAITVVPLIDQDQGIGTIIFAHPHPGFKFSDKQLALVQTFADQAVIAIQNARLFNETQEALERQTATADILKVIASSPSDVQPVFEAIATSSKRLIGGFSTAVFRFVDGMARLASYTPISPAADEVLKGSFPRPIDELLLFDQTRGGEVVQEADTETNPDQRLRGLARARGFRSTLLAPLMNKQTPIGLIVVTRKEPGSFTAHHIQLIQTFADQAVIAIENARLFNETKEALERQTATADILKVIASSPSDVQPVFEAIAARAKSLLGSYTAVVTRVVDGVVHLAAGTAANEAAAHAVQGLLPYPLSSERIHARVARTGELAINTDIDAQSLPQSVKEFARTIGWRSMLVVPMLRNGIAIGTIGITRREAGSFDDKTIDLLKTFSDQAVIAIENTRLFNETKEALERQTATADILKVIASSPSDAAPVFEAIATRANSLVGGFSCTVFRFIDGMAHLMAFTPTTPEADEVLTSSFPSPVDNFAPFQMAHAGEVAQIPDTETLTDAVIDRSGDILDISRARGFRSMLFAPLMNKGVSIGLIAVTRVEPGTFADHHVQLLKTFADQAVIAIENVRLFDEVQAKTRDLEEALQVQTASADVLKVISRSPDALQPVFDVIVETSRELCRAQASTIFTLRDGRFYLAAFAGVQTEVLQHVKDHPISIEQRGSALARSVRERRTIHIPNTAEDPEFGAGSIIGMGDPRATLTVPLMREGQVIGGITLRQSNVTPFTQRQIEAIETFADQAVIAIENARLFDEVQARTRELEESLQQQTATADVLKVIGRSAFDLNQVFETVVESSVRLCGADRAIIFRFDGELLRVATLHNAPEALKTWMEQNPIRPGRHSVAARAALERRTIQVEDVRADPEHSYGAKFVEPFRTVLGVPMLKGDDLLGVILVYHNVVKPFTDKQILLVSTFAEQAAIAIENVRLFDEVQARTRDLEQALRYQTGSANILNVIASSPTDVSPVLQAIVESACELCGAYDALVRLKDGDGLAFGAHHGPLPVSLDKVPIENSTAGMAVIERRPVHVHDLFSADGDRFPRARELARSHGGERTILSVPLLREGESVGAIVLRRKEVHPFSDKQIALLQTFADQAVIAIGNVRLFDEVQAKTRDLEESLQQQTATSEVLRVISSSPGELEPVFRSMLENAVTICDARFGNLFLIDGDTARWKAGVGTPPDLVRFFTQSEAFRPTPGSHMDRVMRTKQVSHSSDDTAEAVVGAAARLGGARSSVCVPMVKDDALVGAIFIYRTEVRPFTDKQIDLLKNFAAQAVIAIENARLLGELRQRTADLSKSLEDLRTAQGRLIQTEKLASLGQLTAGIAHEIKNPLNFVNNFSALSIELTDELNELLKQATLAETLRGEVDELTNLLKDNLSKVVQHGKRADSIVKNMLLHSREGSGEHRPSDVNALVDESLNLAYHGARAEKPQFNVTLQRDFDPEAGMIEVFPQEITRVLLNMITNGFYAVTKRKADNGGAPFEPQVTASTKGSSTHVEIRIRDNGTGIPPDVKEKMFNPFFTTKPAGEGTGLGLSMSHDIIVKQHGGTIDVDTEPGVFTEFKIVLPRTKK